MYGTQAYCIAPSPIVMFENDVKMYGTQAIGRFHRYHRPFENDVKMYGTQADVELLPPP